MGFYNRFILPHVIELAMRQKSFAPYRERVVGAARRPRLQFTPQVAALFIAFDQHYSSVLTIVH